jgi:uncharacterized protein
MRSRLRADLTAALKARDRVAVAALRSALAAIENAEAVPAPAAAGPAGGSAHVAGAVAGVGAGDRPRRVLTDAEIGRILRHQLEELEHAAAAYERMGRGEDAAALRSEAAVLRGYAAERN